MNSIIRSYYPKQNIKFKCGNNKNMNTTDLLANSAVFIKYENQQNFKLKYHPSA